MDLLLASQSPRRRELLSQIGVRYITISVDVPEVYESGESAEEYVCRLARTKAHAGYLAQGVGDKYGGDKEGEVKKRIPTLGADTIVCCHGEILEKPKDLADCRRMLQLLSGNTHQVMTAVCIEHSDGAVLECSTTEVSFRTLTQNEIDAYWKTGEPCDKAGAYAIQGLGAVFVESLQGSYSGVVGLPIEVVSRMLGELTIPVWNDV